MPKIFHATACNFLRLTTTLANKVANTAHTGSRAINMAELFFGIEDPYMRAALDFRLVIIQFLSCFT